MIIFRIAVGVFAALMMIAGVIITPTPLPFGIIIFAIGFLLFAAVAPSYVRGLRRRWKWFDRRMHNLEDKLPEWIAKQLRATDYDHEEDTESEEADELRAAPIWDR